MMAWYSAMTVFIIKIGDDENVDIHRNLYLVKADRYDFDGAFQKVLDRARKDEVEHENVDGEKVQWLLAEIETLDLVGPRIYDPSEIYSEPGDERPITDFSFPLRPELSVPTHSGIMPSLQQRRWDRGIRPLY